MYRRKHRLLRKVSAAASVIEDDLMLDRVHNAMCDIAGGIASQEVLNTLRDMASHVGDRADLRKKLNRAMKKLRRMRDYGRMTTISTYPFQRIYEHLRDSFLQWRVCVRNIRATRMKREAHPSTQSAEA